MGVNAADLIEANKAPPSPAGDKKSAADNLAVTIRRSALLRTEGTGAISDPSTGKERGSKPEWVGLDKELQKKYARFLTEHTDRLKTLSEQHPEVLEGVLHAHDKKLLELFTMETIVEGGDVVKTVDDTKIANFLKTNEGWMVTTQLLEQEAAFMLAAIGQGAKTNPDGLLKFLRPKAIGLQPSAAMLDAVKSDPKEKQYVKTMLGIDLDSPQPAATDEMTKHLLDEILPVRQEFYTKIGVPPKYLDALPEQYIYTNSSNPEQTKAEWAARIQDKVAAAGGVVPGDMQQNLIKYWKARSEVMTEMMQEMIRNEAGSKVSLARVRSITQEKIQARGPDGDLIKKEKEDLGERKEALGSDRPTLDAEKDVFNGYNTALTALQNARRELMEGFGLSTLGELNVRMDKLKESLDSPSVAGPAKQAIDIEDAWDKESKDLETSLSTTLTGNALKDRLAIISKSINERYQRKSQNLEKEIQKIEGEIAKLGGIKKSILDNQEKIAENSDVTKSLEERLRIQAEDFDDITGNWNTVGGAVLDAAALREESVDELISRINAVNSADNTKGWPKEDNNLPENRLKLLRTILEARAQNKEATDPAITARNTDYDAVTNPAGTWKLNDNQLRTMSLDELRVELTTRAAASGVTPPPAIPTDSEIKNAMDQARSKIQVRSEFIEDLRKSIDIWTKNIDREITGLTDKFKDQVETLKVADELMERFDPIIAGRGKIFENPASVARFTDSASVAGDNRYSNEEQAAGLPKGYCEFLDLLFDYKNKANRGEEFKRVNAVLSQDSIRIVMGEYFWPGAIPPDFKGFLAKLGTDITSKKITEREMRRALFAIINRYKDEALGI